ncbi:adenylate kinase 9 isoform X1 [Nothobranchius furzeri]|uniref:Adenylate kinase 9 n=3 Tax=Nothobranchius furzeri TaxID=105023 RepID=A0A1A8AXK4_NOTFU|nr:adenylate kinase 9 [Nothobranchius furzeri]
MDALVDCQIEDESERDRLRAKPTCFVVFGKPGVGKSTLAKMIATSWHCVLIDDTDLLQTHIKDKTKEGTQILNMLSEGECIPEDLVLQLVLARLNSPDVQHYGYVLSWLPFSEECKKIPDLTELMENLKPAPDFIFYIKCPDNDLIKRLSSLKQHPVTGHLYSRDHWDREEEFIVKKGNANQLVDDEEEQEFEEAELLKTGMNDIDQLVWMPKNLPREALTRINKYKETLLRPLEDYVKKQKHLYVLHLDGNKTPEELHLAVMTLLESMAIKRVPVPVLLYNNEMDEIQSGSNDQQEHLLKTMCSSRTVAPGFLWRRSRWGQTCPVALKEGKNIPGDIEFSVGFQDKLYILSSQEAYMKFVTNPRCYLLPPMPRNVCKVSIIGPPQSGKSTMCRLLAQHVGAVVVNVEELFAKARQEMLAKVKEETVQAAIEKIKKAVNEDVTEDHPDVEAMVFYAMEKVKRSSSFFDLLADVLKKRVKEIEEVDSDAEAKTGWVFDNFPNNPSHVEMLRDADIMPDVVFILRDEGNQGVPEMKEFKLRIENKWTRMEQALPDNHCILEIESKSPENLLQEMIQQMEKPFRYVARMLSDTDPQEYEDAEAEEHSDDDAELKDEDERGIQTTKRLLGDTKHFCPVALKHHNVLQPCMDMYPTVYRERTFYFSDSTARRSFIQKPELFTAQTEPLQPPAVRVLLLGVRGSEKSAHGECVAHELGLFYINFRQLLQNLIIAKTKKQITYSDEEMLIEKRCEFLEASMKRSKKGDQKEMENCSDFQPETVMTGAELAIKAHLSDGAPLSSKVLQTIVTPFWKQEPFMSTGFILDGFPHDINQAKFMLEKHLYPDVVAVMETDVTAVQKHLLPIDLEKWRMQHLRYQNLRHEAKMTQKMKISKRAELREGQEQHQARVQFRGREEEEDSSEEDEGLDDTEESSSEEEEEMADMEGDDVKRELEMKIEKRFETDETNIAGVTQLLRGYKVPTLKISASRQHETPQHLLLRGIQPLLVNRESLFQTCQPISVSLAHKLLLSCYKNHSAFGFWDPIQLYKTRDAAVLPQWPLNTTYPLIHNQFIYFFASKENLDEFMLNPLKYLRQPVPPPALPIKIAVLGPPKSGKTTVAETFAQKYGLVHLSIGSAMHMVLNDQGHTELAVQIGGYLSQGRAVPDELAIQCLKVALLNPVCSLRGYVLDGFPVTLSQAKLMESESIIPLIVVELELDEVEVNKRRLEDSAMPKQPHLKNDGSEILHNSSDYFKEEVEHVRRYYQEQHQNWFIFNGSKNKWWIFTNILKEVCISVKRMQSYTERTQSGRAACISRLCITPKQLACQLGEFGQYCPVCLALHQHLVDLSDDTALTHAAEYRTHYYKLCDQNHLQKFLSTPDQFVAPNCPHTLPQPHLLPRKLTEAQVKAKFPQQAEMQGFCPVTYKDGKQRYEALIQGSLEYAVEYKERIYICESKQKQDTFMRIPETYWDQKLPVKVPPVCEPVSLTSLPNMGYLEQGVARPLIKAMTAAGIFKPKFPFLSIQRSAEIYVAYHLKAFNPKSPEHVRQMYKRKLALFEEDCALIPYLSSEMRGAYKPPGERSKDFEAKLNRFLALEALGPQIDL